MQKNKKKKRNLNIDYLLEEPMFYANGGSLWGNSNLNADPYAPIGQMANMAGTIGAGILDNTVEDQHQRINVNKETGMGILKGAGQGAALGANPMLAAATGGLSIAAGAVIGGIGGGLISHKNAKKNAQENHDALIEQYYGNDSTNFADGGQMNTSNVNNQFSKLNGPSHEEGGISLAGAEVEGGEVKWKDYIFSDRLETEKGSTFASVAKRIKNKYKGRENDKLANDSMEIELTKLMKANESARLMKEEMNQASHLEDLKKYGGFVDLDGDGTIKYANGGRMEIARAARKAGLSPERFAKHLINAKIKYADGGNLNRDGKYVDPFISGQNIVDDWNNSNPDMFSPNSNYLNPFGMLQPKENNITPTNPNLFNPNGGVDIIKQFGKFADTPNNNPQGDFSNLGDYPMLNADNIPTSYINEADPSRIQSMQSRTPNLMPGSKQSNVDLINRTNAPFNGVKTSDQLPQRPSYEPGSLDEFLADYGNTPTTNNQKGNNNFGYAEAGLIASNLAGVDNFIKSLKPAQTKFDRINLDELDLSEARLMNARNQAQGLRQSQGNIRANATSSGQALSNLAANNAALTESKINADLSTYLQENQTNVGIRNQERSANNQIGREEYIANEQNRANAQSVGNVALANIGNNTQGYFRDKVMTKADDQQNARMQEIINGMGFNYKWGTDPATDQYIIQFISKGGK